MSGELYAGVDVGSSSTKAVVIDDRGEIAGTAVLKSGLDFAVASAQAFAAALQEAASSAREIRRVIATGYGRKNVGFADGTRTEIACHGKGAHYYFPEAITVVDIGGQDCKIITLAPDGRRLDFKMNRKCAAGTGAFIEEIAYRAGMALAQMNGLARQSRTAAEIGSFCTVFSATEVLALIRQGVKLPEIARGALVSVVKRVMEMAPLSGAVVATGGVVAHNPIVLELLRERLGREVRTPPQAQCAGALGAALYARDLSFSREEEPDAGSFV